MKQFLQQLLKFIYDLNLYICIISILAMPLCVLSEIVLGQKMAFTYTFFCMIVFSITFAIYMLLRRKYEPNNNK